MGMTEVPRCQHVKVNGTQCGSPALRRKRFCYFHDNYRETQARLLNNESQTLISNFPLLEDANSLQLAVMQVIQLQGSGKMDTKVAGLMLYALQTASANIELAYPIQKLVPGSGKRKKPGFAVVQPEGCAGEWNPYKRIVRFVACD
jgi:hypothetical protein